MREVSKKANWHQMIPLTNIHDHVVIVNIRFKQSIIQEFGITITNVLHSCLSGRDRGRGAGMVREKVLRRR